MKAEYFFHKLTNGSFKFLLPNQSNIVAPDEAYYLTLSFADGKTAPSVARSTFTVGEMKRWLEHLGTLGYKISATDGRGRPRSIEI
jgi:hypothetical protein